MASDIVLKNQHGMDAAITLVNPDTNTVKRTIDLEELDKTKTVDTMAELVALEIGKYDKVWLLGYHTKGDIEPKMYYWDADKLQTEHNGGTIIAPSAGANPGIGFPSGSDWDNATYVSAWYNITGGGLGATGVWECPVSGSINVKMFGAKGDGVTDDTLALQSASNYITESGTTTFQYDANGNIRILNIPTSSVGLSSGAIWNDSGTLKIV